jgi:tripartite-type tricarboxylate transporter receptor subunit TctC
MRFHRGGLLRAAASAVANALVGATPRTLTLKIGIITGICVLSASLNFGVIAQTRVMKFVVPVPPGGPLDFLARVLADEIGKKHGASIIVENRPGGAGIVAVQAVAHAIPDGNTILVHSPALVITPQVHKAAYDPFELFAPLCDLVTSPVILAVNAASPYHSLAELIDAARVKPGQLTIASVGPATPIHIGVEMLKRAAHVDMIYVPFKGDSPAVTALLGDQVTAMLGNFASLSAQISAGQVRALAVGSAMRLRALAEVPTIAESGYSNYQVDVWFGATAPAGTPTEKREKLDSWFTEALQVSEVKMKLEKQELYSVAMCGADYATFLHNQYDALGRVIDEAHITEQ